MVELAVVGYEDGFDPFGDVVDVSARSNWSSFEWLLTKLSR